LRAPAPLPASPLPADFHPVRPVFFQGGPTRPGSPPAADEEARGEFYIPLDLPGPERLFRLDSEADLQERIRQEGIKRDPNEKTVFPEEPILSREVYRGRGPLWKPSDTIVEPNYTCYGRLYFQDINAERYGWDLGILQPVISGTLFYVDGMLYPYRCGAEPCRKHDCSAGHCLAGDPVPFLLYPPNISLTGAVTEAAVILALVAIFP
jgi:hypothetical protein